MYHHNVVFLQQTGDTQHSYCEYIYIYMLAVRCFETAVGHANNRRWYEFMATFCNCMPGQQV